MKITEEMIERGAAEVRGVISQLKRGTMSIEEIQPGSLAEDVLRAALEDSAN